MLAVCLAILPGMMVERLAPAASRVAPAWRASSDPELRPQRREFLSKAMAAAVAMPPALAHASYAMQVRACRAGGWRRVRLTRARPVPQMAAQESYDQRKKSGYVPTATSDKEVIASIQSSIDQKRRFREEAGELGAVGYTYTKYTARARMEMEASQAAAGSGDEAKQSRYARPEDFLPGL